VVGRANEPRDPILPRPVRLPAFVMQSQYVSIVFVDVVLVVEGSEREVRLRRDGVASVREVLCAAGISEWTSAKVDGRRVDGRLGLDAAKVRNGSVIEVDPAADDQRPLTAPRWRLGVIGGPDAGGWLDLGIGRLVIGSSDCADLVLSDPSVSPVHALVVATTNDVQVSDLGARNGVVCRGQRAGLAAIPVEPGGRFGLGATQLSVDEIGVAGRRLSTTPTGDGREVLRRPPRPTANLDRPPLPVPVSSPNPPRHIELNIAAVVVPLLVAGALVAVLGDIRFALFALLSPLMALANWRSGRRRTRRTVRRERERLDHELAMFDAELAERAVAEVTRRWRRNPDLATVRATVDEAGIDLWATRPNHEGWLSWRVGLGAVDADLGVEAKVGRPGDRDLAATVGALVRARSCLADAPVVVELTEGSIGIVGNREAAVGLARSLVVQLVVASGPADLRVAACAGGVDDQRLSCEWAWMEWLPHHRTVDELRDNPGVAAALVVVDGPEALHAPSPVAELLASGNVTLVVVAATEEELPASCATVIVATDGIGSARVRRSGDGVDWVTVHAALLGRLGAVATARRMARYCDPEDAHSTTALSGEVGLVEVAFGAEPVDAEHVLARWSGSAQGLACPLGRGAAGELAVIDLVADGPHALIGGTTGSGKSELLRTMVASLAAHHDPEQLVFVLIDYKGGSAFDACAGLPHVVGVVTDLDEHLASRALRSLEAELKSREAILRRSAVSDLGQYRSAGSPGGVLPRLVVMIDEFATLAAELPDFLTALVGIAQRGRSLGVHLVLATQRPQGSVSAAIRANTNLRMALRVQSSADAIDVIDSPVAAELPRNAPGRTVLRLGAGELITVQTAFSGRAHQEVGATPVVSSRSDRAASVDAATGGPTELEVVVAAVSAAWARCGRPAPRRPWLAMLDEAIDLDEIEADTRGPADPELVVLGVADDPSAQAQPQWGWRLADGNLALIGMPGTGTTTGLATAVCALDRRFDASRCHVYVVDMGGGLGHLRSVGVVGDVIAAGDHERHHRLVTMIWAEIRRRRQLPAEPRSTQPLLVLAIDGLHLLLGEHGGVEGMEVAETIRRILAEGADVGVLAVVSVDRPSALGPRLGAGFAQRCLLRLADPLDYSTAGVRVRELPRFVPGRGVDLTSGNVVQIALARPRPACGTKPPPISVLPDVVAMGALARPARTNDGWQVPLGVGDGDGAPVGLTLRVGEHVLVAGPPRSGVTNTLAVVAEQCRLADGELVVVAIAGERSALARHRAIDAVGGFGELGAVFDLMAREAGRRWLVLIDDAHRVELPDAGEGLLDRPWVTVVAGGRSEELRGAFGHWTRTVRRSRSGVLLVPRLDLDGELLGVKLPRRVPVAMVAGRGVVVEEGSLRLAQLAHCDDETENTETA
jgi:DNA segregation ATPase FtsK/SpoIIIE, S-DNA-T family